MKGVHTHEEAIKSNRLYPHDVCVHMSCMAISSVNNCTYQISFHQSIQIANIFYSCNHYILPLLHIAPVSHHSISTDQHDTYLLITIDSIIAPVVRCAWLTSGDPGFKPAGKVTAGLDCARANGRANIPAVGITPGCC